MGARPRLGARCGGGRGAARRMHSCARLWGLARKGKSAGEEKGSRPGKRILLRRAAGLRGAGSGAQITSGGGVRGRSAFCLDRSCRAGAVGGGISFGLPGTSAVHNSSRSARLLREAGARARAAGRARPQRGRRSKKRREARTANEKAILAQTPDFRPPAADFSAPPPRIGAPLRGRRAASSARFDPCSRQRAPRKPTPRAVRQKMFAGFTAKIVNGTFLTARGSRSRGHHTDTTLENRQERLFALRSVAPWHLFAFRFLIRPL